MRSLLASRGGRALVSAVMAAAIAIAPAAASIALAEQVNVFTGINLTGSSHSYVYGTSLGSLGAFDNVISSLKTTTVVGHGFVFWTGPNQTDASMKVCGPSTRNTMPPGFDNTISSYNSTVSCPQ